MTTLEEQSVEEQPLEERPGRSRRREELEAIDVKGVGGDRDLLRLILEVLEDIGDILDEIRKGLK